MKRLLWRILCLVMCIVLWVGVCGCEPTARAEDNYPIEETYGHWIGRAAHPEPVLPEEVEVIENTLDRTKPIYEVYKDGLFVDAATAEIQWMIRDLSEAYNLPEKTIFGLICAESTFIPDVESFDGGCWGLAQIGKYWITRANITHFTDDYRSRDLCDPYDNLLTLAEMMCWARDEYHLDYTVCADLVKYLYWHNTGKDPTRVKRWDYATAALGYADELVTLQS